jgi:hypothetical protein
VTPEGDPRAAERLSQQQSVVEQQLRGLLDDHQVGVPERLHERLPDQRATTDADHPTADVRRPRDVESIVTDVGFDPGVLWSSTKSMPS